jgi:hypothetical protein
MTHSHASASTPAFKLASNGFLSWTRLDRLEMFDEPWSLSLNEVCVASCRSCKRVTDNSKVAMFDATDRNLKRGWAYRRCPLSPLLGTGISLPITTSLGASRISEACGRG